MPNIKQIRADLEPGIGWVHRGFKGFGMILTSQEIALLHTFIVSFVFTFPFYSIKYDSRAKLFIEKKSKDQIVEKLNYSTSMVSAFVQTLNSSLCTVIWIVE